jgi:O-methyltransferase involved in polyketide biosynthesis
MELSNVSRTALLILTCRTVQSEKRDSGFNDPMAMLCLKRLIPLLSEEEVHLVHQWRKMYSGIQARDARARVKTAMRFDSIANHFIANHPGCTVINLACGFDTRFWRISNEKCQYVELDLPAVIELKRKILEEYLSYQIISCSIFDTAWIDQVTSAGNDNFLLLAEGLFMYLPKPDASRLLQEIAHRFIRSQLILDMAPEKYTRGLWKWFLSLESRAWGLDVSLSFGINNPHEMEAFSDGYKVIDTTKGSIGPIITLSINTS